MKPIKRLLKLTPYKGFIIPEKIISTTRLIKYPYKGLVKEYIYPNYPLEYFQSTHHSRHPYSKVYL